MLNIIIASLSVGLGTYLLRKGDLLGIILYFYNKNNISQNTFFITLTGILLNVIGIYFWQQSSKSNLPFQLALSIYLSLIIIVGIFISIIFEKVRFDLYLFFGTILIITGIIILSFKYF